MNIRRVLPVALFAGALILAGCQATEAPPPVVQPDTFVTVDGNSVLRTIAPGLIFGANFGAWVSNTKLGTSTRDLVKTLRPSVGRFPGGNIANNYCWEDQKVSGNDHLVWEDWSWGTDVAVHTSECSIPASARGTWKALTRVAERCRRLWCGVTERPRLRRA